MGITIDNMALKFKCNICHMDRVPFQATEASAAYDGIAALPVSILLDNVRSLYNVGAFFRTADGWVFALVNQCPHRGAPLSEGYVNGCTVACPLHGFIVDLESGNVLPPDEGRAPRISTQVIDGRVFLAAWAVSAPGGWE